MSVPSSSSGPPRRDCSGCCRASRDPRAACRLSLVTAPDPAPLLPATESDGGAPRRYRAAIAATGLESTIIRPGMFASNALFWWATAIRADGVVRWPYGAAETAPVDDRDVAAVAARTLYQDGHAGGDYVLTGPESLSQAEQVGIIGDVLGRRIAFEELSPDEFRRETRGKLAAPGRGHAARRVGRDDRKAGVHHLDGVRHPRIGAAIVSPLGRRSGHRVPGRSNPAARPSRTSQQELPISPV